MLSRGFELVMMTALATAMPDRPCTISAAWRAANRRCPVAPGVAASVAPGRRRIVADHERVARRAGEPQQRRLGVAIAARRGGRIRLARAGTEHRDRLADLDHCLAVAQLF